MLERRRILVPCVSNHLLFTQNAELYVPKGLSLFEGCFLSLLILFRFVSISTQGQSLTVLVSYFDDWPLNAKEIIVILSLSIFVPYYFGDF